MNEHLTFPKIELLQHEVHSVLSDFDCKSISDKLSKIFEYYKVINFSLGFESPLWRVRKCKSPDGFRKISDLYHPPVELTPVGRLNNSQEPLLYVSFNKFTAFTEVGAREDDYLHIIGFGIRKNAKLRCAIIGEIFNAHRSGKAKSSEDLSRELNRILNNSDYRAARSWVFLDAFLAGILSDRNADKSQYIHSRALASIIFEQVQNIDAIYYPSVVLENGINLAIKPEVVDDLLEVKGTSVIRVNRLYDYGIYDFDLVKNATGYFPDGTIRW